MSEEEDSYEERAALVGARVRVALADGTVTRGLLVGVDPETLHVAVAQAVDGISGDSSRVRLKILLSHHVRGVARDEDEAADDVLVALLLGHAGLEADSHKSQHCIEDEETVTGRAARLAAFLERHFVPYEVTRGPATGSAAATAIRLFGGAATLLPPFRDPDACVASENEQLLGRLRPLLARFLDEEL